MLNIVLTLDNCYMKIKQSQIFYKLHPLFFLHPSPKESQSLEGNKKNLGKFSTTLPDNLTSTYL